MGRIHEHLEQVQGQLKDKPTPFLLGQKSVLAAYEGLWSQIQDPITIPDIDQRGRETVLLAIPTRQSYITDQRGR
jgi:hypothetical protein